LTLPYLYGFHRLDVMDNNCCDSGCYSHNPSFGLCVLRKICAPVGKEFVFPRAKSLPETCRHFSVRAVRLSERTGHVVPQEQNRWALASAAAIVVDGLAPLVRSSSDPLTALVRVSLGSLRPPPFFGALYRDPPSARVNRTVRSTPRPSHRLWGVDGKFGRRFELRATLVPESVAFVRAGNSLKRHRIGTSAALLWRLPPLITSPIACFAL
jgi:hypothetical protein